MTNLLNFLTPCPLNPLLPLLVYLPGMDGSGELIKFQLPELSVLYDIRCLSIPLDDFTDWNELVEILAKLIHNERKLLPSRPIILCGESFGGCLALKFAAHYPDLCDRLVLINPASSFRRRPFLGWGASVSHWLPNSLYHLSTFALIPLLIESRRVNSHSRQSLLKAMQSVRSSSAIWRILLLNSFVLEHLPLHKIKNPVLVLASGSDRLLPSVEEANKLINYLPNAKMVILPNSGHACLLESEISLNSILTNEKLFMNLGSSPVSSLKE